MANVVRPNLSWLLVITLVIALSATGCSGNNNTFIVCNVLVVGEIEEDTTISCAVPDHGTVTGTIGEAKNIGFRVVNNGDTVELHPTPTLIKEYMQTWESER